VISASENQRAGEVFRNFADFEALFDGETATVGYHVQIAVDAEHHLIVAHEVINQGYDRSQPVSKLMILIDINPPVHAAGGGPARSASKVKDAAE
jgi:hypothetical protein